MPISYLFRSVAIDILLFSPVASDCGLLCCSRFTRFRDSPSPTVINDSKFCIVPACFHHILKCLSCFATYLKTTVQISKLTNIAISGNASYNHQDKAARVWPVYTRSFELFEEITCTGASRVLIQLGNEVHSGLGVSGSPTPFVQIGRLHRFLAV
jgi:hypothetical protein